MIEEIKSNIIRHKKMIMLIFLIVGALFLIPSVRRLTLLEEITFSEIFSEPNNIKACIYILFIVLCWFWALTDVIKAYRGSFLWQLREDILKSGYSSDFIDTDFETADICYSFRFGKLMFYFTDENGKYPRAYSIKRVLWGYYGRMKNDAVSRRHSRKGIILYVEGRRHPVELLSPSEIAATEYLKLIANRCPWAVIDYSKELEDLYINHRNEFKALKYNEEIAKAQI